jgi:hypothetical protein
LKARLLKLFRKGLEPENKNPRESQIPVFLICILTASIFWILIAFSKRYPEEINIRIRYKNIPEGKVINGFVPESFNLKINTTGFKLFSYYLGFKPREMSIDLHSGEIRNAGNEIYLDEEKLFESLRKQLDEDVFLTGFTPGQIKVKVGDLIQRQIPLVFNYKVSYARQYGLSDTIITSPATVKVEGPSHIIDTLTAVYTNLVELTELKQPTRIEFDLNKVVPEDVKVIPSGVFIELPVEKFTEGSIEIPVVPVNVPAGFKIRLIPEKITVKFAVPLSKFESTGVDMFEIIADFMHGDSLQTYKLKAKVQRKPAFIKVTSLYPERLDFLISK